ncbi:ribbon-helix-helix protein [Corynebacterium variabile]|uniref:ribbon-helix-helix protein n=1 Tax=Corynebacterium variabile TaxID=1727 RepID=UPI003FD03B75
MAVPKKKTAQSAAETLMRSRPSAGESADTEASSASNMVSARDILPTRTTPAKTKLTLTVDPDLKRRLKAAAAADEVTVSELVERWATSWLDNR